MTDDGMVTLESSYPVRETVDRLAAAAGRAGLQVFARIDHGGNAIAIGMPLRPTELLIFGNPAGGTPLMLDRQTAGIDLPLKALAWEDDQGRTWLTYNQARWIAQRHGLSAASATSVTAIESGLAQLTAAATLPGDRP
jgi:uncharacterized protein (DUF302 family)